MYGEADGEASLGSIADLAVTADNHLHLLDGLNRRVVVFDSLAAYVRSYAREGEGPGELRYPRTIDALSDGRTAVGDIGPARLAVFRPDGSLDREIRLTLTSSDPAVANIVPTFRTLPDGGILAQLTTYRPADSDSIPTAIVVVADDGTITDTVITASLPPESTADRVVFWQPHWLWAAEPSGAVITSPGSTFTLDRFDARGIHRVRLEGSAAPVEVTPFIRENLKHGYLRLMERRGEPDISIRQARERLTLPGHLPAIFDIIPDPAGNRVWVESVDPEWAGVWPIQRVYYLVSTSGQPQGCAQVPSGFDLLHVVNGVAYGRWSDELDVPHVRSFRPLESE